MCVLLVLYHCSTVSKTDEQLILPLKRLIRKENQDAFFLSGVLINAIELKCPRNYYTYTIKESAIM
jgi:hypothetical protein